MEQHINTPPKYAHYIALEHSHLQDQRLINLQKEIVWLHGMLRTIASNHDYFYEHLLVHASSPSRN